MSLFNGLIQGLFIYLFIYFSRIINLSKFYYLIRAKTLLICRILSGRKESQSLQLTAS